MTVEIGICSVAHLHADAYAACLDEIDDAELAGVTATEYEDAAREKADEYGAEFREPDDLLERVDGVIVCSENASHGEWIERAAAAGADVLSEKPLATTADAARESVEVCDEAGVRLGVALPLRFSQPLRSARSALEDGRLGPLEFLSGTNRGQFPRREWFADPDRAGGGAVMDHTVHVVDAVRWITGQDVREVYAEIGTRFHEIPTEDVNVLSMELDDGTPFTLDGSWSKPDEYDTWGDATLRLVGRDGVYEADCFDQTIKQTRDTGDPGVHSVFWGPDPNLGLIRDFVDAIEEDRPPEKTGEYAVHDVEVCEAAYESAERGEPVEVGK